MIQKKEDQAEELTKLYKLAESIKDNAKTEAMIEVIKAHQDKVIVFTKFNRTLEHITNALSEYGISFSKFSGSMNMAEKNRAIEEFTEQTQVLVSTEIGGEGRTCNSAMQSSIMIYHGILSVLNKE